MKSSGDRSTAFGELPLRAKAEYIWDYYKFPILLILTILVICGNLIYRTAIKKTEILYVGLINIEPTEDLTDTLTAHYITKYGDTASEAVYLYNNLYLANSDTEHADYVAASRMKILAAIDAQQLDVIISSKEILDAFLEKNYIDSYTECNFFSQNNYSEPVYIGLICNSPRREASKQYLNYLNESNPTDQ